LIRAADIGWWFLNKNVVCLPKKNSKLLLDIFPFSRQNGCVRLLFLAEKSFFWGLLSLSEFFSHKPAGIYYMRRGAFMAVSIILLFLCLLSPCRLVCRCQRFRTIYCLHLQKCSGNATNQIANS
jgi:hypothetical protein